MKTDLNTTGTLILKTDALEQRMVWAEVYAPSRPDVDGEYMSAETIRKMAYDFARDLRLKSVDVEHDNSVAENVAIVETFIARKGDPDFIADAWVVGMHINDDQLWADVKAGKINGFSVEALVTKSPKMVEIEIPDEVVGKTSLEQDHDHQFMVKYSEQGRFLGGQTTPGPDGHVHLIARGTITEETNGHQHRFSSVDNVEIVNG